MSTKEKLYDVLSSYGYPVFLQGSVNKDASYPDTFITYWVWEAPESGFYDNAPTSCDWGFWVYVYSNNPRTVDELSGQVKSDLVKAGFVASGKPIDAASDKPTHTGAMLSIYYKEVYNNGSTE